MINKSIRWVKRQIQNSQSNLRHYFGKVPRQYLSSLILFTGVKRSCETTLAILFL